MPNAYAWLRAVWYMNLGLLVFNLLPIYPLDGGQILRSLLWYVVGRARSLMAATIVGFVGVAGLIIVAVGVPSGRVGVFPVFILVNFLGGARQTQAVLPLG